jgi:hypothetical protein
MFIVTSLLLFLYLDDDDVSEEDIPADDEEADDVDVVVDGEADVSVEGDVIPADDVAVAVDGDTVDVPGVPVLVHAVILSTIAAIAIINNFFILFFPPNIYYRNISYYLD